MFLISLCNIHVLFVFIDLQSASARKPAGMYVFHVLATGVVPYRNLTKTPSFLVDVSVIS